MAKQSASERAFRLEGGNCPVHGSPMTQVGLDDDRTGYLVACTRKDCDIQGTAKIPYGPVTLLRSFEHLLKGE
jgi:hypothetical protein